jgi:hypothetical protein
LAHPHRRSRRRGPHRFQSPLEVARLRRSKAWLICKRRPELAFFMLNLWTAAWHERPAGSLEDDDDVLADAAMCSPERWAKVRADVMRGWVKATDGRLYHPVVAEKVMDSWHGKVVARWRKECDRIRKENHRRKEKGLEPLDFPPEPPRPSSAGPPDDPPTSAGIPTEKPLKGEGEGQGQGEGRDRERETLAAEAAPAPERPPDGDDLAPPVGLDRSIDQAFARWSTLAAELGIPDVGYLNTDRRASLHARLHEIGGLTGWELALAKIREAAFFRETDGTLKRWLNLGWLLKPENFTGLMEGRYAERRDTNQGPTDSAAPTVHDGVAAAFARRSLPAGG